MSKDIWAQPVREDMSYMSNLMTELDLVTDDTGAVVITGKSLMEIVDETGVVALAIEPNHIRVMQALALLSSVEDWLVDYTPSKEV